MRLFIFGIGGTGARVITSLVMQLAAGVRPIDENGEILKEGFSIVPILIDPHSECNALINVCELLNDYKALHNRLYPKGDAGKGFFSVKIETLHDVDPAGVSNDSFAFRMPNISNKEFKNYIAATETLLMEPENVKFSELLFSKDELNTNMSEGFYGSPNIGCVALNSFVDSPDFSAFKKAVNTESGDKVFFIGSIFGGTGASGLPLFITNIRHLLSEQATSTGTTGRVPIGALIVMPYFSIGEDKNSPINDGDFMIKTRSALSYYSHNLNHQVNNIYYIADWGKKSIKPFDNDPGNIDNQKTNKAHIVEFMGAMSLYNFILSDNNEVDESTGNAATTKYFVYGIDSDDENISKVTMKEMGVVEKTLVQVPMMKFYILEHFMRNCKDTSNKPYAAGNVPKIDLANISGKTEIDRIFKKFDKLYIEMESHGPQAHNLCLYNRITGFSYTNAFQGVSTQKGIFGHKNATKDDLIKLLNSIADTESKKNLGITTGEQRWYHVANLALEELIIKNYNL